jgi:hypothetical protein
LYLPHWWSEQLIASSVFAMLNSNRMNYLMLNDSQKENGGRSGAQAAVANSAGKETDIIITPVAIQLERLCPVITFFRPERGESSLLGVKLDDIQQRRTGNESSRADQATD